MELLKACKIRKWGVVESVWGGVLERKRSIKGGETRH